MNKTIFTSLFFIIKKVGVISSREIYLLIGLLVKSMLLGETVKMNISNLINKLQNIND